MNQAGKSPVAGWALSPRAARVFYGAADAWFPPGADGTPGAGDLDVVAHLGPHLRGVGDRRRLQRTLAWLEASPRLLLHSRRGFCWLSRDERRAWLERGERSPWPGVADALRAVRGWAEAAYLDARRASQSPSGP